jgi:formyl-CoA transferase
MGKALTGVRVLDMTHVQSGPSCTQLMAWLGADVIKIEPPGRGDITRAQLRDLPNVDSLYFTMLNCNKRSVTLNLKADQGKEIFRQLVAVSDVLVENFAPGALDRLGFPWDTAREINPRLIYASIKGFGAGPFVKFKAYETIAQAMGGSMSTTGYEGGPPTSTGAQIGDSGSGMHALAAILAALYQRVSTGRGQRVEVAMQDAVLNLCRVKVRDQQRLQRGPLPEYPTRIFGDAVPRTGNASGGGQPGGALKCKPGGPNDYIYVIIQPQVWPALAKLIGRPELIDDPAYATPEVRLDKLDQVFAMIEEWTQQYTKFQAMERLNAIDVPCGPILDIKEMIEDKAMAERGMIAEVRHPQRGVFKTVGCQLVLSDTPVEENTSPL